MRPSEGRLPGTRAWCVAQAQSSLGCPARTVAALAGARVSLGCVPVVALPLRSTSWKMLLEHRQILLSKALQLGVLE